MKSFFDKEEYSLSDIQLLIDTKAEESLYVEFKSSGAFDKEPKNKHEIGKDISAFANSDGGIIIYGLEENSKRQASKITYIDSIKFSADWLQQVIESNIKRVVPDVIIYRIQNPEESTKQIYLVKIPVSANSPHMAMDNKYYRRNNAGNIVMEEYEVRGLYNQASKTNIEILDLNTVEATASGLIGGRPSYLTCILNLQVCNVGNIIEHYYKFELHINSKLIKRNISYFKKFSKFYQRTQDGLSVFSIGNIQPIFQNEITSITKLSLVIDKENIDLVNSEILLKLYYSFGIKEKSIKLRDLITYNLQPILSVTFS